MEMDLSGWAVRKSKTDCRARRTPRKFTGAASPQSTASTRPSSAEENQFSVRPSVVPAEGGAPIRPRAFRLKPQNADSNECLFQTMDTQMRTAADVPLTARATASVPLSARKTAEPPLTARTRRHSASSSSSQTPRTCVAESPIPVAPPSCPSRDGRFVRRAKPEPAKEPVKEADPSDVLQKRRDVNMRGRNFTVWSFKRPQSAI